MSLKECNTKEDPVRPELDNIFRRSYGRKIYGVKYGGEIHAVMCFAYTNEIPKSVEELDKFSHDAFYKVLKEIKKWDKLLLLTLFGQKKKVVETYSKGSV